MNASTAVIDYAGHAGGSSRSRFLVGSRENGRRTQGDLQALLPCVAADARPCRPPASSCRHRRSSTTGTRARRGRPGTARLLDDLHHGWIRSGLGRSGTQPLHGIVRRRGGNEESGPLGEFHHESSLLEARLGSARLGSARLGSARLGSARLGSARHVGEGSQRSVAPVRERAELAGLDLLNHGRNGPLAAASTCPASSASTAGPAAV
jgi:hypothetical protein